MPLSLLVTTEDGPTFSFKACGQDPHEVGSFPCYVVSLALGLEGKKIDNIVESTPPLDYMVRPQKTSIDPLFEVCATLDEIYEPTGQDRIEVLWRTLICDTTSMTTRHERPAPSEYAETFLAWMISMTVQTFVEAMSSDEPENTVQDVSRKVQARNHVFRNSRFTLPNSDVAKQLARDFHAMIDYDIHDDHNNEDSKSSKDSEESDEGDNDEDGCWGDGVQSLSSIHDSSKSIALNAIEYGTHMSRIMRGRCLFSTEKKLLGLGPQSLQVGDELWLLRGAQVPFILRRKEGSTDYVLIGEAYVHGIMYGEAMGASGFDDFVPVSLV